MATDTETVLGGEAAFTGKVTGESLSILGRFEGEIQLRGLLRVGSQGFVKASVEASTVEVMGEFEGEIRAGSLTFSETARARGVFKAERLTIREGAVVEGAVNLTRGEESRHRVPAGLDTSIVDRESGSE